MNDKEFLLHLHKWLISAKVLTGSYFLYRLKAIADAMNPETFTATPQDLASGRKSIHVEHISL